MCHMKVIYLFIYTNDNNKYLKIIKFLAIFNVKKFVLQFCEKLLWIEEIKNIIIDKSFIRNKWYILL